MKKLLLGLFGVLLSFNVFAQNVVTGSKLAWDQVAPSLADASGYSYFYYADGATPRTALANVTCVGTSTPFQCSVNFPAFTPGNHTIAVSASNIAGESAKSNPLAFIFVVVPGVPTNLRIQ